MKNPVLLLLLIALLILCPLKYSLMAQEAILNSKHTLQLNKKPFYKAMIRINQMTGYNFSYNSDLVDENKLVSYTFSNHSLHEILDSLFNNDTNLAYDLVGQHIVIRKNDDPALPSSFSIKNNNAFYVQIQGKVVDEKSGTPLSYANVGLLNKGIGTISNHKGDFILKFHRNSLDDTLAISYMGYENALVPLKDVADKQVFPLKKKFHTIQEIIVRLYDAEKIVMDGLNRLPDNYHFDPLVATGFYRETIQKEQQYTSISEAVLQIYKPYQKAFRQPRISILKSRKSMDTGKKDSLTMKLKAGLEAVLLLDIIHERISFFDRNADQYYRYIISDISYFDGHNAYVISFSPKVETDIPLYSGKLFIDVQTLALVKAEFHLNRENLEKISDLLIIKKKWDIHVNPKAVKYFVDYRRIHNKYFLNQIRGELAFKVRKRNQLFGRDFKITIEMLTSKVDTSAVEKFQPKQLAKPHKVFIEQLKSFDQEFWGPYNYIRPVEPLEKVIQKLGSKIDVLEEFEQRPHF